jgi:hypothetical protein
MTAADVRTLILQLQELAEDLPQYENIINSATAILSSLYSEPQEVVSEDLKRCPFCGSTVKQYLTHFNCDTCPALIYFPICSTTNHAKRLYNERPKLLFPQHKCSLTLAHNNHKDYYTTVEQAIESEDHGYRNDDWISKEQKQKAIETNDCWTIQWYPETPIGFVLMSGADLDVLLEAACND